MPLGEHEFAERLAATGASADAILREHLEDNEGELLLHPLVARIRDLTISCFDAGNTGLAAKLVAVFDAGLRDGNAGVQNAVAVSFIEDAPYWDPALQPFFETWPKALRTELQRLQDCETT